MGFLLCVAGGHQSLPPFSAAKVMGPACTQYFLGLLGVLTCQRVVGAKEGLLVRHSPS